MRWVGVESNLRRERSFGGVPPNPQRDRGKVGGRGLCDLNFEDFWFTTN